MELLHATDGWLNSTFNVSRDFLRPYLDGGFNMKIYSSKLDDIRKARDEWDAESNRRDEVRRQERANYEQARHDVTDPIELEITENLQKFNLLDFEVRVEPSSGFRGGRGIEVRIGCNQNRIHDEDSALSWDWKAQLDSEGNVVKSSGSWSGLNATTEANMNSLRQCVSALEYLNSVDWSAVLDVETPEYSAFYSEMEARGRRPDFEFQMKEAELEELIGRPIAVLGTGIESLGYGHRARVYYIIRRETPKKYIVNAVPKSTMDWYESPAEAIADQMTHYTQQIKKEYLLDALNYPFETVE